MIDALTRIAQYKRAEIAEQRARLSEAQWRDRAARASPPRGFAAALEAAFAPGRPALIAEIKKASPSKGLIRADFEPAELARAYARGGAACLSVLTDGPSFQGEDAHLAAARAACALPCLRKDFLLDPWQATQSRILGADAILVILTLVDDAVAAALMTRAAELGMDAIVEAHDEGEMRRAAALGARLIGINNRDLRSFRTDLSTFERLAPLAPAAALLTAESGIASAEDAARMAAAGARAVLVGESLMRQEDVAHAARALTQSR